jgi:hypothetical protein
MQGGKMSREAKREVLQSAGDFGDLFCERLI